MLQDLVLLVLAILPSLFIADYIYKSDSADSEPSSLLASLICLGAVSCVPASLIEGLLDPIETSALGVDTTAYLLVDNFLVVALAEEGCKYFFLRLRTWKHPAFDYRFDGIVYAVMVGLGFATFENVLYVFTYGFGTGVVRALLSVPGHASWAVIMGYYYGRMKLFDTVGDKAQYRRSLVGALLLPILCHGIYDTLMSMSDEPVAFLVGVAFSVAIDVSVIRLVKSESAGDEAILKQNGAAWGFSNYGAPVPAVAPAPAPAPAWQSASASRPAPVYPQQAATSWKPAPPAPYAPTYSQQPAFTYNQQPYASTYPQQPVPAAKSSKGFLGKWIGGYVGVFFALFIVAIIVDYGFAYDLVVTLCALMVIAAVPYVAIGIFAWRMRVSRERRLAQGTFYGGYVPVPSVSYGPAQNPQGSVQYPQQPRL